MYRFIVELLYHVYSVNLSLNYTTEEVNCGIGSDCEITLICNNRRFIVLEPRCPLSCSDKPDSIEYIYLKRLDDALESKDPLEVDTIIEEISGFVATLC